MSPYRTSIDVVSATEESDPSGSGDAPTPLIGTAFATLVLRLRERWGRAHWGADLSAGVTLM